MSFALYVLVCTCTEGTHTWIFHPRTRILWKNLHPNQICYLWMNAATETVLETQQWKSKILQAECPSSVVSMRVNKWQKCWSQLVIFSFTYVALFSCACHLFICHKNFYYKPIICHLHYLNKQSCTCYGQLSDTCSISICFLGKAVSA